MRHHSIAYTLKNLTERQILRPYLLTNVHAVGMTDYCVFFNCLSENKSVRKKVVTYCLSSKQVAYFVELTGPYRFSVSLFCRTVFEVTDFFSELQSTIPDCSFEMSFALRLRFTQILGKFSNSKPVLLDRARARSESEIDETDRRVLAFYSQNADLPLRKIAILAGTSESTLRYRLKQLEDKGIIIGYPYFLDFSKVGISTFRVIISASGVTQAFYKSIFSYMTQHARACGFVHCAGSWDFELSFALEDPAEFAEILAEIDDNFGANIRSLQTFNEIVTHKAHHFPLQAGITKGKYP